ncbi:DUF397 domain-containing protein [Streptomyces sp. NPDC003006]
MTVGHVPAGEPTWFKSSYSGGNETECVEVAITEDILIRDSKRPASARVTVQARAWTDFLALLDQGPVS